MEDRILSDILICTYGLINGRRLVVIANDFKTLVSNNSKVNLKKIFALLVIPIKKTEKHKPKRQRR